MVHIQTLMPRQTTPLCLLCGLLTCLLTVAVVADSVQLDNGDVLHGKVIEQHQEHIILEHPTLGILKLKAQSVVQVVTDTPSAKPVDRAPGEVSGKQVAADANENQQPLDQPAAEPTIFTGWKSQLELGGSGAEGNSQTTNLRIVLSSKKESDTDRWLFDSRYYHTESNRKRSRTEGQLQLTREWLRPGSPWFSFGKGVFDYDEFRPWEYRVTGHGGVGYQIVKSDQLEMSAKLGIGGAKELEGQREFRTELLINLNVAKWAISEKQYITADLTVYPNLEETSAYRAVGKIEWVADVDSAQGLKLKLGIEDEFESDAPGDTKRNDFKYYGTLVLDF